MKKFKEKLTGTTLAWWQCNERGTQPGAEGGTTCPGRLRPFVAAALTFCRGTGLQPTVLVCREHSASILIAQHCHLQFRNYSSILFLSIYFKQRWFFLAFFFFFFFLPSLPSLPLFLFFPHQCWMTFTRTQCDLVTLGIL